jgi:hypothetical protein
MTLVEKLMKYTDHTNQEVSSIMNEAASKILNLEKDLRAEKGAHKMLIDKIGTLENQVVILRHQRNNWREAARLAGLAVANAATAETPPAK